MPYANAADANVHLSPGEIVFTNTDAGSLAALEEAERIVKGQLTGYVSAATLTSWEFDPNVGNGSGTPDEIQEIAGKLAAAVRWRAAYADNASDINATYGQKLYDEAFSSLQLIKSGSTMLDGVVIGGADHLTEDMFFPNDATAGTVDDRKFTMGRQF